MDDEDESPRRGVCGPVVQLVQTCFAYVILAGCVWSFTWVSEILVTHSLHPAFQETYEFLLALAKNCVWALAGLLAIVFFLLGLNHVRIHREEIVATIRNVFRQWYLALLFGGCSKKKAKPIAAEYGTWWHGRRENLVYDPGEFLVASLLRWKGTMLEQVLGDPIGKPTFYALMIVHGTLFYIDSVYHLDPLSSDVIIGMPVALMIFLVVFYGNTCYERFFTLWSLATSLFTHVMDWTTQVSWLYDEMTDDQIEKRFKDLDRDKILGDPARSANLLGVDFVRSTLTPTKANRQLYLRRMAKWRATRGVLASLHLVFRSLEPLREDQQHSDFFGKLHPDSVKNLFNGQGLDPGDYSELVVLGLIARTEVPRLRSYSAVKFMLPLKWALNECYRDSVPRGDKDRVPPYYDELRQIMLSFQKTALEMVLLQGQTVPLAYFHVLKMVNIVVNVLVSYLLVHVFEGEWPLLYFGTFALCALMLLGLQEIAIGMSDPFGSGSGDFDTYKLCRDAYNNAVECLKAPSQPPEGRSEDGERLGWGLLNPLSTGDAGLLSRKLKEEAMQLNFQTLENMQKRQESLRFPTVADVAEIKEIVNDAEKRLDSRMQLGTRWEAIVDGVTVDGLQWERAAMEPNGTLLANDKLAEMLSFKESTQQKLTLTAAEFQAFGVKELQQDHYVKGTPAVYFKPVLCPRLATAPPATGTDLKQSAQPGVGRLAKALASGELTFTKARFEQFEIRKLRPDSWLCSAGTYYRVVVMIETDAGTVIQAPNSLQDVRKLKMNLDLLERRVKDHDERKKEEEAGNGVPESAATSRENAPAPEERMASIRKGPNSHRTFSQRSGASRYSQL